MQSSIALIVADGKRPSINGVSPIISPLDNLAISLAEIS
jgi:hypothetical protein